MGTSPDQTGDRETGTASRPAGLSILIVAAVVVVIAIVAAAVIAATGNESPEPGSPEEALQSYLDALIHGDMRWAYGLLSQQIRDECSLADLRNDAWQAEGVRVTLDSVSVDGDVAELDVTIVGNDGGGVFGQGSHHAERFILTNNAEGWALSERPWPIYFCSGES